MTHRHQPPQASAVFESPPGFVLGPDDTDGMADLLAEAEADGWEGEHVFDASVEDFPHPFFDKKTRTFLPVDWKPDR